MASLARLRPLLRHSLNRSKCFKLSDAGTVTGHIDIDPYDRQFAGYRLLNSFEAAERLGRGGATTQVVANPTDLTLAEFMALAKADARPPGDHFALDYDSAVDENGAPCWGAPYTRQVYEDDRLKADDYGYGDEPGVSETLHLTLVAYSPDNVPVGFFRFEARLDYYLESTELTIELPLVYTRPGFRNKTYGLDLATATAQFLRDMYSEICRQYRRQCELVVRVEAEAESSSGERIAEYLAGELEAHSELLQEMYPRLEGLLDAEVIREIGR